MDFSKLHFTSLTNPALSSTEKPDFLAFKRISGWIPNRQAVTTEQ